MKKICILFLNTSTKNNKSAFTLVELIIVITILAILATIAFVSFQNYVRDSRDSHRLATLKNIETGLQAFQIKTGNYPEVENATVLQASGVTLSFQGYIGDSISKQIQINTTPKDPLDQSHFIYATNDKKNNFQILTFLENKASAYIPETLAQNYSQRIIKTLGNNVGIILNQDNSPITQTTLDILQNNSGSVYKVFFQENELTLTGKNLITPYSAVNKHIAFLDESLIGYWDMESLTHDGKLKDHSKYEHHGILGNGLRFTNGYKKGQAIKFQGRRTNSFIDLGNSVELNPRYFTVNTWIYAPDIGNTDCYNYIYSNGRDVSSMTGIDIKIYCGYQLSSKISLTDSGGLLTYNPFYPTQWSFLTISYDPTGKMNFYINAKLVKSTLINLHIGNTQSSFHSYIGGMGHHPSEYALNGYLDDFRIYKKALSQEEILHLYNSYEPGY